MFPVDAFQNIAKLIRISKGSHKSRRDVRQIYRRSSADDRRRICDLARQFEMELLLNEVLDESDEMI